MNGYHVADLIVIDPEDIGIYVAARRGSEQVVIEDGTKLWRYNSPLLRKIG